MRRRPNSGGLGVGSSNLPAPTNKIKELGRYDRQFFCKTLCKKNRKCKTISSINQSHKVNRTSFRGCRE